MKRKLYFGGLVLVILAALVWVANRGCGSGHRRERSASTTGSGVYSCPMHPQIRQPEFGQCPLCGMDLVPIAGAMDGRGDTDLPVLEVSPRAAALMELQTAFVERRPVQAERRFLGMFGYDETRLHDITVRTEGQLEQLFVNYTGVPIRKGEHIAELYSPEFYSAARDLLVARSAGGDSVALAAARQKLHLLNVTESQIDAILEAGEPADEFTLYSPVTGVITQLDARQGTWIMKGQRIAQVADITSLWVLLDAYESDIALIHYGQQVELDVPAFPGRIFTGFVAYVAPDLNERTRTIKVRLNVPNPDGRLRPGMFAHALLQVPLTSSGEAYGPELAEKFICPMHPEITGARAEPCSICRMDLEPASSLDPIHTRTNVTLPLVIPDTAPLITGRRALVYVQLPDEDHPVFEGRNIRLGPRAGGYYLVLDGLTEGERVVTHGNFKIDSELQIRGRPSMMSATDADAPAPPVVKDAVGVLPAENPAPSPVEGVPATFPRQVAAMLGDYFGLVEGLAGDDFGRGKAGAAALGERVRALDAGELQGTAAQAWQPLAAGLLESLRLMNDAKELEGLRQQLPSLSRDMERAVAGFGGGGMARVYRVHCPMAFGNRGADWLQPGEEIANPYLGAKMLRCGEITGRLP